MVDEKVMPSPSGTHSLGRVSFQAFDIAYPFLAREREREKADGYNDVLLITCDLFQMLGVKTPPEPSGSLQRFC